MKERTECQIFSRVCGWLVPRHCMNPGKQAERKDLVPYKIDLEDICKE
jgi:anaerobic ribonucleoside-triphosphate reductase